MKSLLGALGAMCNISSDDGEDLFVDELLKLDMKWRGRKMKSRKEKSRTALRQCTHLKLGELSSLFIVYNMTFFFLTLSVA